MNLVKRLKALEESCPGDYRTFDAEGHPVIQSNLSALGWFLWATKLFRSRGREAEKKDLRQQLRRSFGPDSARGRLYEVIAAMAAGPVKKEGG